MRLVGAAWSPTVNQMVIICQCGARFFHRADRWRVACRCGAVAGLGALRDEYARVKGRPGPF